MNIEQLFDAVQRYEPEIRQPYSPFTDLADLGSADMLGLEAVMKTDEQGNYVRYSDYERLVKMMKESEREITRLHGLNAVLSTASEVNNRH